MSQVHATGTVKETMKKFWSTKDAGQKPFTYQAGVGGVITGWDQVGGFDWNALFFGFIRTCRVALE